MSACFPVMTTASSFNVEVCGCCYTRSRVQVLSLGDARSYYLSTAKNELGVVYAKSAAAGACLACVLPVRAGSV